MREFKSFKALLATAVVAAAVAIVPAAPAQVSIQIGVPSVSIGIQPNCRYGYYDYPPYRCAPGGYYGSGYFYNGIFLGVGPWSNWGYGHGWGGHRFAGAGGGHYVANSHGNYYNAHNSGPARSNYNNGGNRGYSAPRPEQNRGPAPNAGRSYAAPARNGGGQTHAAPAGHPGGGEAHGGGESHGGGEAHGGGGNAQHGGGERH